MISLNKALLPSSVKIDGIFYAIHTDFQYFLNFLKITKEEVIPLNAIDFMFVSEIPGNKQKAFDALINFTYPKKEIPRTEHSTDNKEILLDYDVDADLIYSAFYEKYKIDLCDESLHLHWYKFQALLNGLTGTKLNDVMSYRAFKPKGKTDDYQKEMLRLKKAWRIEEQLTEKEKLMVDEFEKVAHGQS